MSTEYLRLHRGIYVEKVKDVEPERALRLYHRSPDCWSLQLRSPLSRSDRSDGADFVVATAHLTLAQMKELRGALDKQISEEEALITACAQRIEESET